MKQTKHKWVPKGWGGESWIVNKEAYCGKVLFVKKDHKCSWHYHLKKDETFFLQSGALQVRVCSPDHVQQMLKVGYDEIDILGYYCESSELLGPGDSLWIPPLTRHQFRALEDSVLFEFSTFHDDNDVVRLAPGDTL